MSARIHTIMFDADEHPLGAVIFTSRGIVEAVRNQEGWTLQGAPSAKKLAKAALRRVERWPADDDAQEDVRCRCCGRECEDGWGMCDRCERTYGRE
jgi:hypothetical protein